MNTAVLGRFAAGIALGMMLTACAHVEPPTGGPEDKTPPVVIVTRPDSLALVPGWREPVRFAFSERISERGVEDAIRVSPRTSTVNIDRGSDEIRVSLRGGWRPGTIYHVTLEPEIQDLFGNALEGPVSVVFSTGPEIPETRLAGTVTDLITGEAKPDVRVEVIRAVDSLVYSVPTDTAGNYVFTRIPTGDYLVRAYPDLNRNRTLQIFEPRDSAAVAVVVGDTASARLRIVMPDSTAPVLGAAEFAADTVLRLEFDDYLDPGQPLSARQIRVVGPADDVLPIARVAFGELPPIAPAADDTVAEAAPQDTVAPQPSAPADTAAVEEPLPTQAIAIELAPEVEIVPGAEYRVYAEGIRNVVGLVGGGEIVVEAPAPTEETAPSEDEPPAEGEPSPAGEGVATRST